MDDRMAPMIPDRKITLRKLTNDQQQQTSPMELGMKVKIMLFSLHLCYLTAFILMVTSVCTSSWYTTHPLAPTEQTSYGSLGLIEHCDKINNVCEERKKVMQFKEVFWPYRPLKNKDFDATLLMLIISMVCTVTALSLSLHLRSDSYNLKQCFKWLLLLVSIKSVLSISSLIFLDTQVRSDKFQREKFRHGWSSYVIWTSVGLSTLTIIPVVYLLRQYPTRPGDENSDYYPGTLEGSTKEYILPQNKHHCEFRYQKQNHCSDVNCTE